MRYYPCDDGIGLSDIRVVVYCCSSYALSEYNDPKRISVDAYDVVAHPLHDGVMVE